MSVMVDQSVVVGLEFGTEIKSIIQVKRTRAVQI